MNPPCANVGMCFFLTYVVYGMYVCNFFALRMCVYPFASGPSQPCRNGVLTWEILRVQIWGTSVEMRPLRKQLGLLSDLFHPVLALQFFMGGGESRAL